MQNGNITIEEMKKQFPGAYKNLKVNERSWEEVHGFSPFHNEGNNFYVKDGNLMWDVLGDTYIYDDTPHCIKQTLDSYGMFLYAR